MSKLRARSREEWELLELAVFKGANTFNEPLDARIKRAEVSLRQNPVTEV